MNILIVSRTPWNNDNSFGNTFTNLFGGIQDIDIFNICCQKGSSCNNIVKQTVQMTDMSALKSIKGKDACKIVFSGNSDDPTTSKAGFFKGICSLHLTSLYLVRDLIWKISRYKKSKTLEDFLESAKPDLVYLPLYSSWYMCDIDKYIISRLKVPVAGHISDDIYSFPKGYLASPLFLFYRSVLRKKLRALIEKVSYIDVFTLTMKTEYGYVFGKPCYLIGKGIAYNSMPNLEEQKKNTRPIKFIYTGNIGGARYKTLVMLGKALDKYKTNVDSVLEVYSQTPLTINIAAAFRSCKCIEYMGSVGSEQIKEIQKTADYLVHAESFSPKSIFLTRMSFSTKIIDYMIAGKPILAIGPKQVDSINLLKEKELAVVIDEIDSIEKTVGLLLRGNIPVEPLKANVIHFLQEERNIQKIRKGMLNRMNEIVDRGKK